MRGHPDIQTPDTGEPVFFKASDGRVLGTETQRRRQANMARLRGTGKDPLGRYGEGEIFDVPTDTDKQQAHYEELLENGFAEEVEPEEDPGRTGIQIPDAVVAQGGSHQLQDPVDQALAESVRGRELDIVHTENPDAEEGDAGLDPGDRPQDPRQVTPGQVSASSIASADPEKSARLQKVADGDSDVSAADVKEAREAGIQPQQAQSQGSDGQSGSDDGGELKGEALQKRASELNIEGRSDMNADQLRAAVAKAEAGK